MHEVRCPEEACEFTVSNADVDIVAAQLDRHLQHIHPAPAAGSKAQTTQQELVSNIIAKVREFFNMKPESRSEREPETVPEPEPEPEPRAWRPWRPWDMDSSHETTKQDLDTNSATLIRLRSHYYTTVLH